MHPVGELTAVGVLLSDDKGIQEVERARHRRLVADDKQRIIKQDIAFWTDGYLVTSWTEKKAILWDLSKGKCHYCNRMMNPFSEFSVDHIIARSKGGTDDLRNLVACCRACNIGKSVREYSVWQEVIRRREERSR